jgi:uncharacterized protein YndB with AHSA1/START domain
MPEIGSASASQSPAKIGETERAVFKVFIHGTIEEVWHEITKTDEVQGCFFNMWMDTTGLKPGAPIRMRTKNRKYTMVMGEVISIQPPYRYSHTFRFTQYDDPPCIVTYELKEVADGVEFTMILDDLPKGTATAKQMKQGGTMIVNSLKAIVETGRPSFGVRILYSIVFPLVQTFSPKKTRSENWPL